jgi:hypothetical protein
VLNSKLSSIAEVSRLCALWYVDAEDDSGPRVKVTSEGSGIDLLSNVGDVSELEGKLDVISME